MHRRTALALCCALIGLPASPVEARSNSTWAYPLQDVFSTAVRFIRIEQGCTVTDKDPQSAYLLFECKDGKQVKHGALEMFQTPDGTRCQLTLADQPEYMELHFLEMFGRKLREERGFPVPPAQPPPAPPATRDGGASP